MSLYFPGNSLKQLHNGQEYDNTITVANTHDGKISSKWVLNSTLFLGHIFLPKFNRIHSFRRISSVKCILEFVKNKLILPGSPDQWKVLENVDIITKTFLKDVVLIMKLCVQERYILTFWKLIQPMKYLVIQRKMWTHEHQLRCCFLLSMCFLSSLTWKPNLKCKY